MLNSLSRTRTVLLALVLALALSWASPALADGSGYVDFKDFKLFYEDVGQGKPTIVFVHGWTGAKEAWELQAPELAKRNRLVLLDLPGHGKSSKPNAQYTQKLFADAVVAVMDHLKVNRAVLVGHSMGYSVARQVLLHHPKRVIGLVSVDGAVLRPPKDKKKLAQWQRGNRAFADRFKPGPDYEGNLAGFLRSMAVKQTPKELVDRMIKGTLKTPQHVAYSAMVHMGDVQNWTEQPSNIPVLAIYARTEYLYPDMEQYLKRLYPNCQYKVWEGVSHFYMFERPAQLTKEIRAFVDGIGEGGS